MRIADIHSHNNGHEYIMTHKPDLWAEIEAAIAALDFDVASRAPSSSLRGQIKRELEQRGWKKSRLYWSSDCDKMVRRERVFPADECGRTLSRPATEGIGSHDQIDFLKDRTAIMAQLGDYSLIAYDLFVKHTSFFIRDEINVGVEIMPMKSVIWDARDSGRRISTRVAYYERGLQILSRQEPGVPAVPLVLVGIGR